MTSGRIVRWVCGIGAAALVAWSSTLPLWTMTMRAPQYPAGLKLLAYGTWMTGDVSELNILNHYIGMPGLHAPALETAIFPYAVAALVLLCVLAPLHRMLRRFAMVAVILTPIGILADLQWRVYEFGHSLNPEAPIRLAAFTPKVIGSTAMGNFKSFGMPSWGVWSLLIAALLLWVPGRFARSGAKHPRRARVAKVAAAAAIALLFVGQSRTAAEHQSLQALIDAAPAGGTLEVPPGDYSGPVTIRGPLTVITSGGARIDGGGHGSVVSIEGTGVVFRGFTVRNSGREVTEEAAGITLTGNGHVIERNHIEDVYFGIHAGEGHGVTIRDNVIAPGEHYGARPGHGISTWHLRDSTIAGNRISQARDGIYLSFTERMSVTGNIVTGCRYGLHSMYSMNARFEGNQAESNLLGAALMTSDRLIFRGNRIARHRDGPAAYGVLLKDIGDLTAEDNLILSNRIGIYAESVPSNPSSEAVLTGNVIAGNEVGLALQSTASLVITRNRIAENLTDVRPLGRQLSTGMQWSRAGRGNSWGRYRGFDANGDGIGDLPFQLDDAMDALVRKNPSIQALLYTPAHLAIEAAARMFPVYRQPPVLVDSYPLMTGIGAVR